jgi:hypothetical protein
VLRGPARPWQEPCTSVGVQHHRFILVAALASAVVLGASGVDADSGTPGTDAAETVPIGDAEEEVVGISTIWARSSVEEEDDTAVGEEVEYGELKNAISAAWGAAYGAWLGIILGGIVNLFAGPEAGLAVGVLTELVGQEIGDHLVPERPRPTPPPQKTYDHDGADVSGGPVELGRTRTTR